MSIPTYVGWLMVLWLLVRTIAGCGNPSPCIRGIGIPNYSLHWRFWWRRRALSIVTAVLAVKFRLPRVVPRAHVEITNFELAAAYGITWCFAVTFEEVLFRVYLQSET